MLVSVGEYLVSYATARQRGVNRELNKLYAEDRPIHEWYRFVLSFPPHLVRDYLERFDIKSEQLVLDPFCGTGTVLVECKKRGIASIGIEASPMAHFASQVKVDWHLNPEGLLEHARQVADAAIKILNAEGIEDNPLFRLVEIGHLPLQTLSTEKMKLLLTDSLSPLPLHKTLVLLDCLEVHGDERYYRHERLALAKALAFSISNLHFGPEVGVGAIKLDTPVISTWLDIVRSMASDLHITQIQATKNTATEVHLADARQISSLIEPHSIDAVITSPPYPNEKDYTRTTRLESVLLGFIQDKAELQTLKRRLLCSNTRNVYSDDVHDTWVNGYEDIQQIAEAIEAKRVELGKTSGFERLYARATKLYFGGMLRHLAAMRTVLRPGAKLAYVVGDQASYFRIKIPTGQLLADIATSLGYEVTSIDLFRTRFATATKEELREEVVVLRWQ